MTILLCGISRSFYTLSSSSVVSCMYGTPLPSTAWCHPSTLIRLPFNWYRLPYTCYVNVTNHVIVSITNRFQYITSCLGNRFGVEFTCARWGWSRRNFVILHLVWKIRMMGYHSRCQWKFDNMFSPRIWQIQIQMGICRARLTNCPGALTNVRMLCETGEL